MRRAIGFGALGVGAASVLVGGLFGGTAIGDRNESASHCRGTACDAFGASRYRDAQDAAKVSTVLVTVGLVAVAAGAVLVVTSKRTKVAIAPGLMRGTF